MSLLIFPPVVYQVLRKCVKVPKCNCGFAFFSLHFCKVLPHIFCSCVCVCVLGGVCIHTQNCCLLGGLCCHDIMFSLSLVIFVILKSLILILLSPLLLNLENLGGEENYIIFIFLLTLFFSDVARFLLLFPVCLESHLQAFFQGTFAGGNSLRFPFSENVDFSFIPEECVSMTSVDVFSHEVLVVLGLTNDFIDTWTLWVLCHETSSYFNLLF